MNHCEYGEPTQTITDVSIVAAAADAIAGIVVTGGSDGMSSTGTYYVFQFSDTNGDALASFAFQDGMLMENDGRYPLPGLDALYAVDGVMLAADCRKWKKRRSGSAVGSFPRTPSPSGLPPPSTLPSHASLLAGIDPASIHYMRVSVSWNDYAGTIKTGDPETIRALYEALSNMRVVEKVGEDDPTGQEWSVYFSFTAPDASENAVPKTAYLSFEGDYLLSDMLDGGTEMPYIVEGLDKFFDSADADVLRYLKAHRNASRPEPTYS